MHNIRVLCGNPLDLCRHKAGHTHPAASPERLLTAMSLYSSKLSGLVVMVDGRITSLGGIKEGGYCRADGYTGETYRIGGNIGGTLNWRIANILCFVDLIFGGCPRP